MVSPLPRFVLAAPASGQGKTTVSVGVMAALTARGTRVAPAKVGPDFIDPGYHALATGRPGRNLDPWLQGEERLAPLLLHGALTPEPADVAVIEGVMGLFDGRLGTEGYASSAHVARATHSPVVLVVDISSASRSVAAIVHGLRTFDPEVQVAGVILNKSGSSRHAGEVRRACERIGVDVLGCVPRDAGVSVPSRHLGLVPAQERDSARAMLVRLAEQTAEHVDLDALLGIAASAPPLDASRWQPETRESTGVMPVVAVAGGRAFTFRYAETEELMRAQGLQPVVFDPIRDRELPSGTQGLYLGGGFPEVHARSLATNKELLGQLRAVVHAGLPTVAECAGMLYLLEAVDGHAFAGVLPASAGMSPRLTLGYREATVQQPTLLADAGAVVRGHEFHRTVTHPGAGDAAAWHLESGAEGFTLDPANTGSPTVHASYLHTHWAGYPELAQRFADAVHRGTASTVSGAHPLGGGAVDKTVGSGEPLAYSASTLGAHAVAMPHADHHGDQEVTEGLADFAVNVRSSAPPVWLSERLGAHIGIAGSYPDLHAARAALASHHGVEENQVLLTNGASEAFTLIARGLTPQKPVIVHPQFAEPGAALRRAGISVCDVILPEPFRLPSTEEDLEGFLGQADDADCVVIGNPTNPTGVLHPALTLNRIQRPGRTLIVDEAFMDLVPGEAESLIGGAMTGTLVVRSLTKSWSIAGLRAGYVVGEAHLIERLAQQQPHWSVNSLAAEAVQATCTPAASRDLGAWREDLSLWRSHLIRALQDLGLDPLPSAASFVLVQVGDGVHQALRQAGFAVRRCDTFPGLDGSWIRIAVRDPLATDALIRALRSARSAPGASTVRQIGGPRSEVGT